MTKSSVENINAVSGAADLSCEANLFLSAVWRDTWWDVWGQKLGLTRCDMECNSSRSPGHLALYGYLHDYRLSLFRLRRFQPIGNYYPSDVTILSEYTDLVSTLAFDQIEDSDIERLLGLLEVHHWDDLVLPFCGQSSRLLAFFTANKARYSSVEIRKQGEGVCVDTSTSFDHYLSRLGKNTRLKLFNRRTLLAKLGHLRLEYAASEEDISNLLETLNELDRKRWGKDCFGPDSLSFHRRVATGLLAAGKLQLSVLLVNEQPVSVLYNMVMGDREYNIQSAYLEDFHPKISLGTLHLGYGLERAFSDRGVACFDLLYGEGKNEFYKSHFNGHSTNFYTVHVLRSKKALVLYGLLGALRQCRNVLYRLLKLGSKV